jgi:hypothetical protein
MCRVSPKQGFENLSEDIVRSFIMASLEDGKSWEPQKLAQAFYAERARPEDPKDGWRKYLNAMRQQALSLARAGRVEFTHKGKVIELDKIKGVIRLRKAQPTAEAKLTEIKNVDE